MNKEKEFEKSKNEKSKIEKPKNEKSKIEKSKIESFQKGNSAFRHSFVKN